MGDSLLLKTISEIKIIQDTTLTKLESIDKVVNSLKSESIFLKLLPLIGVVIGGFITWWIQKSLKDKEIRLTFFKEIRESSNKILTSLINLQFHLKELAYLEVDSKYQYYISLTEQGADAERAINEHYNDYKYIAEVKNKISSCVADINSNFSTYYKLTNTVMPDTTSTTLLKFTNHILTLRREAEFDITIPVTTVSLNERINLLSNEYVVYINNLLGLARSL